ncbi:hypothetical protein VTN96DRAFT_7806 [Rasamsonia emersonii]
MEWTRRPDTTCMLCLHDSWLKPQWRSQDILFACRQEGAELSLDRLYLSWHVSSSPETPRRASSPRSDILFPLGRALVELSLGRTISAQDSVGKAAKFNIADTDLQRVHYESGSSYGDVVKHCLFSSGMRAANFEDQKFEEYVFDAIVSPLLKDWIHFEGLSD